MLHLRFREGYPCGVAFPGSNLMPIDPTRYPVFEKIATGETPAQICALWGGTFSSPVVERKCVLCDAKLAMDARNEDIAKQMNAVAVCPECGFAIMSVVPAFETGGMVGGKIMSVEEGHRVAMQELHLKQSRN